MYDERDVKTKKVVREGVITRSPHLNAMRRDIWSTSVSNPEHYRTMEEVYKKQ